MSETLAEAGRKADSKPYVCCKFADHGVESPHLSWTRLYSGTEGDQFNDAVIASDGSINRIRASGGRLYHCRVTSPATASQWSSWTTLVNQLVSTLCQPAICAGPEDGDEVRVFWVDLLDDRTIKWIRSTDQGATWGPVATVLTEGNVRITGLAADGYRASGMDNRLFYAVDPGGRTNRNKQLAMTEWDGSSWSTPSYDDESRYRINGISVAKDSDDTASIWVCDGSPRRISLQDHHTTTGWGGGGVLIESGEGSNYDYELPRAASKFVTGNRRHFIGWVERYKGAPTRDKFWTAFTARRWTPTELVQWQEDRRYGARLLADTSYWYIVGSDYAYRAPVFTGTGNEVYAATSDDDLVAMELDLPGINRPGRLLVRLDNSRGKFASTGSGALQAIKPTSQVELRLGYRTPAGEESVQQGAWFIDRLVFRTDRGRHLLEVHCIDPWTYLNRLVVRRPITYAAQTANFICRELWLRVCGAGSSGDVHANMDPVVPNYLLRPGQNYLEALRRLNHNFGLVLRWRGDGVESGVGPDSVVPDQVPYGSGVSDQAYLSADKHAPDSDRATGGPDAGYAILWGEFWSSEVRRQSVEVYGDGYTSITRDWAGTSKFWRDNVAKVVDLSLNSQSDVDSRAAYETSWLKGSGEGGRLESNLNPGLEIGDVIDITDSNAGLSGAARVVVSIRSIYDSERGQYRQFLGLAGGTTE